nr:FRB-ORK [Cloning vector pMSx228]
MTSASRILWHEMWHEGLEEASRLYFGERNVKGMFEVLEPLHAMMERGPQTLKETSFNQAYGRDLMEAQEWCRKYMKSGNVKDLLQAWDLYYHVFRRISKASGGGGSASKTEVRKLMQRLDGLVNYADALRERSHEFMNKLHVILGLLHLKSYKQLEDYILKTANNYQEEIGSLLGKIKSPVIAGFLISKINRATDLGHTLILNSESQLPDSGSEDQVATLITTLGNLIENALEALGPEPGGEISVTLHYRHGWLHCEVNDDGPGIAPDKIDHIFDKGVSTKGSERGVGLALVKQQVENLGGSIAVESEPGIFTQFFVQIPWDGERSNRASASGSTGV